MTACDVLVVGGGPAGAWTARILAEQGWHVVLWDRSAFPRDKPCGEYLSPGAVALLKAGGAGKALGALGPAEVTGARIHDVDGAFFDGKFQREDGPGCSLRRTRLDAMLLETAACAGMEVRTGVAFRSSEWDGRWRTVEGRQSGESVRIACRLLVGADGNHSAVAREMRVVHPIRRLQKVALVTHARGIAGMGSLVEMHAGRGGCIGLGPGPCGETNVTVVVHPSEARAIAVDAGAYVRSAVEQYLGLRGRFESAVWDRQILRVGTFGHTVRSAVTDGVLLVGDSAAFVDPFTGEGVYFALRGAEMAADRAGVALRNGSVTAGALQPYERDRRAAFAAKYALCGIVERVVSLPPALRWVAGRLAEAPALADDMIRTTGDVLDPKRVLSVPFWSRLLS